MVKEQDHKHTALIVEDDLDMAEDIADLLLSLGHNAMHVPSLEEAMELVEQMDFCYVILDLQIFASPRSLQPRVDAGKTLLQKLRCRYPCRNQNDQHHFQILVMSGYAKENSDVVDALQNGGNDFIVKPLSENTPSFGDKILQCLQRSGRTDHGNCAAIMNAAKRENLIAVANPLDDEKGIQLSIPGIARGRRTEVLVDNNSLLLPDSQLQLLMHLVSGRIQEPDGWVHKYNLGAQDSEGFKGISNLNSAIRPLLPDDIVFYENDRKGSYRINPEIEIGRINHALLEKHGSSSIRQIASSIQNIN
ncbi:MAG: response regulator [Magnetococcales bacterium]|nr:response regulator [Magnetococcales bacterium]